MAVVFAKQVPRVLCTDLLTSHDEHLERLFNYCHFANEVIGPQRGEIVCLGLHGVGLKPLSSFHLSTASCATATKARRPDQTFPRLSGFEICKR